MRRQDEVREHEGEREGEREGGRMRSSVSFSLLRCRQMMMMMMTMTMMMKVMLMKGAKWCCGLTDADADHEKMVKMIRKLIAVIADSTSN